MKKGEKATAESKPKNVLSLINSKSPYKKWAAELQVTLRQPESTGPA